MFIPKNEQGVIYLFSRYHEKLGFEKIQHITTHFPDVIAISDGKEIRIELEFLLSGILSHYIIKDANPHTQKWVKENEDENRVSWRRWDRQSSNPTSQNYNKWIKSSSGISISKEMAENVEICKSGLIWRSLKPFCDIVICWEIDCELDDPEIEIIELKSILPSILSI